jgi:hypothetical protein
VNLIPIIGQKKSLKKSEGINLFFVNKELILQLLVLVIVKAVVLLVQLQRSLYSTKTNIFLFFFISFFFFFAMDWTKQHQTAINIQPTKEVDLVFKRKYSPHCCQVN